MEIVKLTITGGKTKIVKKMLAKLEGLNWCVDNGYAKTHNNSKFKKE